MIVGRPDRVLLVGFMGAGKSTVGRRVAERLGWHFVDVDLEVEARAERTIAQIFESEGEDAFRRLERSVAHDVLTDSRVVVATGGGWAARPEWPESLPDGTLSIWLAVGVDEARRRAAAQPGVRPLMGGAASPDGVVELHERRLPYYALADVRVDTEGSTVEDVTARVLEVIARSTDRTRTE